MDKDFPFPALTRSIPINPLCPTPFGVPLCLQDLLYFWLASLPRYFCGCLLLMFSTLPPCVRVALHGAAR